MVVSAIARDEDAERDNAQGMLDGDIDAFLEAAIAAKLDGGGEGEGAHRRDRGA